MPDHPSCTPKTSAALYAALEYYREYMPTLTNMSSTAYAATREAKNADDALNAYRKETGVEDTYANSMFRQVL